MPARRDKRFRVTGEDEEGDIWAFESDSRERAEAQKIVMAEDLQHVEMDAQRRV